MKAIMRFECVLEKTGTAGIITTTFREVVEAFRERQDLRKPDWKQDEVGKLGNKCDAKDVGPQMWMLIRTY